MNGFKFLTTVLLSALALLVVLIGISMYFTRGQYRSQYDQQSKTPQLIHTSDNKSYITDTDLVRVEKMKIGHTYILHMNVLRRANPDCFAAYVTSLWNKGGEFYQLPPRFTTILVDREQVIEIPLNIELRPDMAPGLYHVFGTVYPTCVGFSTPPYDIGLSLDMDIER